MPRGIPPVGTPVQYFKDPTKRCPPSAAIIVAVAPNGMCSLALLPTATGVCQNKPHVFLYGDPELAKRVDTQWAASYGVWDYIPGLPRLGEMTDADIAAQDQLDKEQSAKILAERQAKREASLEAKMGKAKSGRETVKSA